MKRKNKKLYIIILFIIFLSLSVGYSLINRTLTITGNSGIKKNVWDIHFENINITKGSVDSTLPTIDNTNTTISFASSLNKPGEYFEFSVDVVNEGTIDAVIESVTKNPELTTEQQKYLIYTIEYQNGLQINKKQLLKKEAYLRLKIRVEYKKDLTAADLPTTSQTLNLSFTINYLQNDSASNTTVENNGNIIKIVSGDGTKVGDEICIENECFYVISSNDETTTMLAKYNLYIGGTYNNGWIAYGNEVTNKQDSNMLGWVATSNIWKGVSVYSDSSQKGTNYSDYQGSIMEQYVNNYKNIIEKMGVPIDEARLIYKEELTGLGCKEDTLTCLGVDNWIYSTSYWTATPYDTVRIWNVGSDGEFKKDHYTITTCYGVRPVIVLKNSIIGKK